MTPVWIRGNNNCWLQMDGSGVTSFSAGGGGTVNCPFAPGGLTDFFIVENPDGTINIESVAFPGVFLRMDGRGVEQFTWSGLGTVNCQFGAGPWETFILRPVELDDPGPPPQGFFNIESVAFPGVFLRMDGISGPFGSPGTVNCQFGAEHWETVLLQIPFDAVTVPDVINLSPDEARTKIVQAGLTSSETADNIEGDFQPHVESQDPTGGTLVPIGSTVNITVAVPVSQPVIPDVIGMDVGAAERTIIDAGFKFTSTKTGGVDSNVVTEQSPLGGTISTAGTTVHVWYASRNE